MAGYNGYSMSNNAVEAYDNGEMPLSKWKKADIIEAINRYVEENEVNFNVDLLFKLPVKILKTKVLAKSSWHHTSNRYNKTDFYSLDEYYIDQLTDTKINEILEEYKNAKNDEEVTEEKWICEFLEWSGSRKHPKATVLREVGVIKGNWFYRSDGSKKSIRANGFRCIERIN